MFECWCCFALLSCLWRHGEMSFDGVWFVCGKTERGFFCVTLIYSLFFCINLFLLLLIWFVCFGNFFLRFVFVVSIWKMKCNKKKLKNSKINFSSALNLKIREKKIKLTFYIERRRKNCFMPFPVNWKIPFFFWYQRKSFHLILGFLCNFFFLLSAWKRVACELEIKRLMAPA